MKPLGTIKLTIRDITISIQLILANQWSGNHYHVPHGVIIARIASISIEFQYVTFNKSSEKLVVYTVKYDDHDHGKDYGGYISCTTLRDMLFSELYFAKQLSDHVICNIGESLQKHKNTINCTATLELVCMVQIRTCLLEFIFYHITLALNYKS